MTVSANNSKQDCIPKFTIRKETDIVVKNRQFVFDAISILFEKVFALGEDTNNLLRKKRVTDIIVNEETSELVIQETDLITKQDEGVTDGVIPNRKEYLKRLTSRAYQQLYVDWIRKLLDSRFSPGWHVVFGKNLGFAVKYRKGSLGMFGIGKEYLVLIYKSPPANWSEHYNKMMLLAVPEVREELPEASAPTAKIVDWYTYNIEGSPTEVELLEGEAEGEEVISNSDTSPTVDESPDSRKLTRRRKPSEHLIVKQTSGASEKKMEMDAERQIKVGALVKRKWNHSKEKFSEIIICLQKSIRYYSSDSAVFARSVRFRMTAESVASEARWKVDSEVGDTTATTSTTTKNTVQPPSGCDHARPNTNSIWHVYTGTDFVESTAVAVENKLIAVVDKPGEGKGSSRIVVFQDSGESEEASVSPIALAKAVFGDPKTALNFLPYFVIVCMMIFILGRTQICKRLYGITLDDVGGDFETDLEEAPIVSGDSDSILMRGSAEGLGDPSWFQENFCMSPKEGASTGIFGADWTSQFGVAFVTMVVIRQIACKMFFVKK